MNGDGVAASVIIPTWNGAHHLAVCLDSLGRQSFGSFETIVVDNGSTDGTRDLLAAYPSVRPLWLPRNIGFAGAVNAGIQAARSDVLVLLNNDTEVEPDWLGALVAALDGAPGAGMATSKVRLFDARDTLHTTGDTVNRAGQAANRGVWEVDEGQYDDARWVFGASGAAAAYRRGMLDDVGPFCADFGSYFEDVDLAWRARLRGWRCVFAPGAVVYHKLSATGGGPLASYLVARNRAWTILRCYPSPLAWRSAGRILAAELAITGRALHHVRGAAARATLRGQLAGWLGAWRMLGPRRAIQRRRLIGLDAMDGLLRGREPAGPAA
ncbi:MAG: glycosyltransferase family 2 protein [Ardenticatenales bacterium]